jgi:rhodanese-related sulfurtransferase
MLAEAQTSGRQPLVLDVRNSYEWDAGHFEGAQRPLEVRSRCRCPPHAMCAALLACTLLCPHASTLHACVTLQDVCMSASSAWVY